MKKFAVSSKNRGMAIIITLFTTLIILTLGVSFLMISFRESKTTRGEKEGIMALQLANSGVELMLNFMSDVDNWQRDDNFGYALITSADNGGDINFKSSFLESQNEEMTFSITAVSTYDEHSRLTYIYTVGITPDRKIGDYKGRLDITIEQKVVSTNQIPNYFITSVGGVYMGNNSDVLARRTVQARVREATATDNMLFVQNIRAWDVIGGSPPNAANGTNDAAGIANGSQYYGNMVVDGESDFASETAGSLHFMDNDGDASNGTVNGTDFYGSVSVTEDDDDTDEDGNHNVYPDSATTQDKEDMFHQGMMTNQASRGLPQNQGYLSEDLDGDGIITGEEKGFAVKLAQDSEGSTPDGKPYIQSYYRCGDNDGIPGKSTGDVGHSLATDPSQWFDTWSPFNTLQDAQDEMDHDSPADIEFDGLMLNGKPGFAKFIVKFREDGTVSLYKQTKYTKKTYTIFENKSVSQFKHGLLCIEGGNVEVSGTCKGQLTVLASEDPTREPYGLNITTSEGTVQQSMYYAKNIEKFLAGEIDERFLIPGKTFWKTVEEIEPLFSDSSIYVSWKHSGLPARMENGELGDDFDRVPPYYLGGKWVWPAESSCNNTISVVKKGSNVLESVYSDWTAPKEGNIVIAGDLKYADNKADNVLGIIAKNYILLNDSRLAEQWEEQQSTGSQSIMLNIQAVLMSFDHSLQFDDVNLAGKTDSWICAQDMNGTLNFKGSYISPYADIEGKIDANGKATIGYTQQEFRYDPNLNNIQPPNFPRWDPVTMSQTHEARSMADPDRKKPLMYFVVMSYQDEGSLKLK